MRKGYLSLRKRFEERRGSFIGYVRSPMLAHPRLDGNTFPSKHHPNLDSHAPVHLTLRSRREEGKYGKTPPTR